MNSIAKRFAASRLSKSQIYRASLVLNLRDRKKVLLIIIVQICLGIFDLVGVAVFGVMGSLAVSGVQSQSPNARIETFLRLLGISEFSFQNQAAILAVIATSFLLLRTFLTVLVTKRTMLFLSRRGAAISSDLVARLLSRSLLFIQKRTTQQTLFAVTQGVATITIGVLSTVVTMISDFSLLIILSVGLFLVDPVIAISTLLVFGTIIFVMYRTLHTKARLLGNADSQLQIRSNEKVLEVLNSYRESVVRNRRNYYSQEIGLLRYDLAKTQAELSFMPYIGKYVLETSVVIGALIIAAIQFAIHDAVTAVATLSIFLVAGTRISPAALRLQQALIQIKASLGGAEPTLSLIHDLRDSNPSNSLEINYEFDHSGFNPDLRIEDVDFSYPGSNKKALDQINLDIESGSIVALVGPSGGGKTTLVDVFLGILKPDFGSVLVSNLSPIDAINQSPGAISYVPQDVSIIDGSIRENVAMGFPLKVATNERVNQAIQIAGLTDFVNALPGGLDTQVGENGAKISGGQRQRLGIARAMFTEPKLLVLDEATSALDGETESRIAESILGLKGKVTVIMIAHRLSTVRDADQVIYIEEGKLIAKGAFGELRSQIPDFDQQARLMGL
jgi:ABC-type multidrug transport system fused ATPase/permease subunit